MSEEQGRVVRVKRLQIGTRVSGAIGEFIENDASDAPGTKKRRRRARVIGTIIESIGPNRYRLRVDGSDQIIEAPSCQLRVESNISTLPPDIPVATTIRQDITDEFELENQEPDEHLPVLGPEADDQEEEMDILARMELDSSDEEAEHNHPVVEDDRVTLTPYQLMKQRAQAHIESLVGRKVVEKKKKTKEEIEWTVIASHSPSLPIVDDRSGLGVKGLEEEKLHYSKADNLIIGKTFLYLMFIDYKKSFATMNSNLAKENITNIKPFTEEEILVDLSLLIGKII